MVDTRLRTSLLIDYLVETERRSSLSPVPHCVSPTYYVSHSQTSTVENTVEDLLMLAEDDIASQQEQRILLDAKFDYNNEQTRLPHLCSPPPWSPTEVNTPTEVNAPTRAHSSFGIDISSNANVSFQDRTPSTRCQSSPYVRPTVFARGTKLEKEDAVKVQRVQEMMGTLPDHLVLELLNGSRVRNLLAAQQKAEQAEISFSSERVAVAEVEQIVIKCMDKYFDEGLDQKIKGAFKPLVCQRLDKLVQNQLPLAVELFLNGAVEDLRDQSYEDCKMNEANLREVVDDGRTQLHDQTKECLADVEQMIRDQISEFEDQSDKFRISVGEQLACLGYWSDKFVKSTESKKHATNKMARCESV
ncbi:hypothetical protein KCU64_g13846, partial [Aureobasidium melanogenum]